MKSNDLLNEIKSVSNELKKIFSPIHESTIISEFYICILENLVYRTIFENFFNNLTKENIEDCNLYASDLIKIKNDFKQIQRDIKISADDMDEVIFTKDYYYSSKKEILLKYPTLEKIFSEIEKTFDLDSIENFIKNQKLDFVEDSKDYRIILNTLIFEDLIKNKRFNDIFEADQTKLSELIDINELTEKLLENSMQITKWEIWKTYSTYTNRNFNIGELKKLSEILVKNNIVTTIFDSGCNVLWKDGGEKVKKDKILDLNSLSENLGLLNKLPDYAAEGIYQFYLMWVSEDKILKNMHSEYPYIKGFLSPINVNFTTGQTKTLYPQLTIYNTGILNLTFRIMSPDRYDYELTSFIYNEINSHNLKIKDLEMSYEILDNIGDFDIGDLENNKTTTTLGSFKHDFVKLDNFENLLDLTQFLISVISFHISKKFRRFDYYENYWLYSQSVYLLDYKNQPYHKEDIIKNFNEDLIQILYQLPLYDVNFSKELPEDLRELNQYCLFIIEGMSLWVSSKDELENSKDDINNEKKIYEKQVLVEAINHFNLLVNKFYEISYYNDENYDNTMELQEYLINFERFFKTTYLSNFGEINHVLNYCYEELEWEELIKLSNELLEIKKNHQINRKNENLQYLVILIAILSFLYQYVDRLYINILIGIVILFFLYLIFKEKIHYLWQVLKSILKFFYYKIV